MADVKPTEVPETTPAVVEPVAPAAETAPAAAEPAADAAATEETKPAESTEAAAEPAATEEAKKDEEVKPVEEGTLEHKGAPAGFPKNLMFTKHHFWFGQDAIPVEKLSTYLKNEKATDVAHHVAAWATETGKGLFFYSKESDKSTPHGAIQLVCTAQPAPTASPLLTPFARPRLPSPPPRVPTSSPSSPRATSTPSRLPTLPNVTTGSLS